MPMKERRRGISTIVGCGERDLISALPDEIIYDIFARLRSQKQTAQAALLSRRWADLWRSYPILEIYLRDGALDWVEDRSMRHAAAVLEKFSRQSYIEAVRIAVTVVPLAYKDVYFAFVNGVLDLAAKKSASEIDFDFGTPCHIPASLLLSSLCRLRVLKLRKCCILGNISGGNDNPFASFGSSLKVLCLYWVTFSDVGVLNSMIEAASLLENLSLAFVRRLERLEVTNHTKLKTLEVERCNYITDINIIGAHSLEILRLEYYNAEETDLHVSLTPNVKLLHLRDVLLLTDDKLNKLISEFPSLETLVLDKLYLPPIMIKIDSSRLTKFVYHPYADCFPTILFKPNGCKEASLSLSFSFNNGFHELKQFLVKSCQFRLTLHFTDPVSIDRNHTRRKLAIFKLRKERERGTSLNETTWNLPTKVSNSTKEQP
ncbi:F-box protein At5g03100 [Linum perenne]